MNDHTGWTIGTFGNGGFRVLCRCGWQGERNPNQDAAEAEHELHVELVTLTADDFARNA